MKVRIRMYRQGLGDCFLLTFWGEDDTRHVLIDCGSLGAPTTHVTLDHVIDDIAAATNKHLTLLVATHEHEDHVAGFRRDWLTSMKGFTIDHVWQAWTEDRTDPKALEVQKYAGDLLAGAALAARAMADGDRHDGADGAAPARLGTGSAALAKLGRATGNVLAFNGRTPRAALRALEGENGAQLAAGLKRSVQEAMANVTARGTRDAESFLKPCETAIEREWLPGLRCYVLGPPRSMDALRDTGESGHADIVPLDARARQLAVAVRFRDQSLPLDDFRNSLDAPDRQALDAGSPFDRRFRLSPEDRPTCHTYASYHDGANAWRRIDSDWLMAGSDMALQLDNLTNNTSLALAFEIKDTGQVLLFPADAQAGNWLSWYTLRDDDGEVVRDDYGNERVRVWKVTGKDGTVQDVTARDLLGRAVVYKVGHHASHNGTLDKLGIELMAPGRRNDLVALIPVDRRRAKGLDWNMPADGLYARLMERTNGRVLRSDIGWPKADDEQLKDRFEAGGWEAFAAAQTALETDGRVVITERYIDYVLDTAPPPAAQAGGVYDG